MAKKETTSDTKSIARLTELRGQVRSLILQNPEIISAISRAAS